MFETKPDGRPSDRDQFDDGGAFRVYKLDRRRETRGNISGTAMAAFSTGHDPVRLASVDLLDASPHGMGVLSPVPVESGATLCLYPTAAPGQPNLDVRRIGMVVRCEPRAEGYIIGVRCAAARQAA